MTAPSHGVAELREVGFDIDANGAGQMGRFEGLGSALPDADIEANRLPEAGKRVLGGDQWGRKHEFQLR